MSAGIRKLSPRWLDKALPKLLELYKDTIRLEYAYEYFLENYDEFYKERIATATEKLLANTDAHPGGGRIADKNQAIAALGAIESSATGTHVKGTNWLNVKTKWRQFGLITGYNMQFQAKSVLDIRKELEEQGSWSDFMNDDDDVARTQQLLSVQSPRYKTSIGGSSEPGLSLQALSAEDKPGASVFTLGEKDWFYSKVHQGNAAPPDAASTTDPRNVRRRQYDPGDSQWFALTAGTADRNADAGRHSLDPLYYGTTIQIDKYFDQDSTARAPKYGHLLSPEIMDLITLVGVNNKKLDRQLFLDARASLMTSGLEIWNAAAAVLDPGGYQTWITTESGTSTGDNPNVWSKAHNAYGASAHASYNGPKGPSSEKSKSSKVVDTGHGQHIFPDRLAILKTLPLEGIPFFPPGPENWNTWDTFPGDLYEDLSGAYAGTFRDTTPQWGVYRTHIIETVPAQVKTAWRTLFEGFENKSNNIAALDTSIRNYIGTGLVSLYGGSEDPLANKGLNDHVERILDFFGAGAISENTAAQDREKGITGGSAAAPNLAEIDPAALDVVANFRSLKPFDLQCFFTY